MRLFRRDRARWVGATVRERLQLSGQVEALREELCHYSFRDKADHWARCRKYAQLWAESQHEAGQSASICAPYVHAAFRWLRGYVLRRGFLDGSPGWRIAGFCAREVFLKYRVLRQTRRNP